MSPDLANNIRSPCRREVQLSFFQLHGCSPTPLTGLTCAAHQWAAYSTENMKQGNSPSGLNFLMLGWKPNYSSPLLLPFFTRELGRIPGRCNMQHTHTCLAPPGWAQAPAHWPYAHRPYAHLPSQVEKITQLRAGSSPEGISISAQWMYT